METKLKTGDGCEIKKRWVYYYIDKYKDFPTPQKVTCDVDVSKYKSTRKFVIWFKEIGHFVYGNETKKYLFRDFEKAKIHCIKIAKKKSREAKQQIQLLEEMTKAEIKD